MRGDQLAQQFRPILLIEASPGGAYRRAFIDTCKFKIPPTISRKVAKFARKTLFRFGLPTMILPRLGQGSSESGPQAHIGGDAPLLRSGPYRPLRLAT